MNTRSNICRLSVSKFDRVDIMEDNVNHNNKSNRTGLSCSSSSSFLYCSMACTILAARDTCLWVGWIITASYMTIRIYMLKVILQNDNIDVFWLYSENPYLHSAFSFYYCCSNCIYCPFASPTDSLAVILIQNNNYNWKALNTCIENWKLNNTSIMDYKIHTCLNEEDADWSNLYFSTHTSYRL